MFKEILNFCRKESAQPSSAFSRFFAESSSRERKKMIKETVRAANKNQKSIINRYEKLHNNSK